AIEHPVPHLRMPQPLGRVLFGQFGEIEAGGKMVADAVDNHGAGVVGKAGEAVLDRENDAVVERIALGRAVEADRQHRAGFFDFEQPGLGGWRGEGGVSHRFYWFLSRIVMFYNYWHGSQEGELRGLALRPHCEQTGRAYTDHHRHCERSEAIHLASSRID